MTNIVAVIGCGKLGLPLVSVLAQAGHKVVGLDLNKALITTLKTGKVPWFEPELQEAIMKHSSNITFTSELADATEHCSIALVIVPTPSDSIGKFQSESVERAIMDFVASRLKTSEENLLIVIISTLMPGDTARIKRRVEELAGERSNRFKIVYSPEFIALGSVLADMRNPSLVLIGSDEIETSEQYKQLVKSYIQTQPHFADLTFEGAEIAKIGVNSYVTMKISFANFISELCDLKGNASASDVLEAIGSDKRIGRAYLKPGTPFGGPCFPRDNVALARFGESLGVSSSIPITIHEFNESQVDRIANAIDNFFPPEYHVVLVGLAYKPGTAVTEESASLKVMKKLSERRTIFAIDSYLSVEEIFPEHYISQQELQKLEIGAVLMVPDDSYDKTPELIGPNSFLLDCWGNWIDYSTKYRNRYRRLGEGPSERK